MRLSDSCLAWDSAVSTMYIYALGVGSIAKSCCYHSSILHIKHFCPTCVRKEVYRWAKPIVWVSTFAKSRSLQPLDFKHLKSIEWNAWNNLWSTKRPSTLGISQMNSNKYLVLTQSLSIPHLLLSTSIAANHRPAQDCNHAYASMGLHWHTTPNGCTELS